MNDFVSVVGHIDYRQVQSSHGEFYRQTCLDRGESPAGVAKKLQGIRRFFNLAIHRKQLDENPLSYVKAPKVPKKRIRIYTEGEIDLLVKKATEFQSTEVLEWDLTITLAITTGLRKSELLNLTWDDINFEQMTVEVNAKVNADQIWEWRIKDTDHRTLPLTEDVKKLLLQVRQKRPESCPYILVPPARHEHILRLRQDGKWTLNDARNTVINNFTRQFNKLVKLAAVNKRTFHDIRRTAITSWFRQGLSEYDVMTLAGHANFETTHKFYLAIADDLISRARKAVAHQVSVDLLRQRCQDCLKSLV